MEIKKGNKSKTEDKTRERVFWQAFTLVVKCQHVKAFYLARLAEALFDTQ